jgi:outer membrane immunogenic protein
MKVSHLLMGASLLATMTLSSQAHQRNFSGFYIGAQLGAGETKTSIKFTQPYLAAKAGRLEQFAMNGKNKLSASGMIGGLHVGYGKQFPNCFYLGLEAYGNLIGNSDSDYRNEQLWDNPRVTIERKYKIERNNSFGLALRPGFIVGNTLFYAKLGVESANFKYSVANSESYVKTQTGSANGRRIGFVPGIGVSFNLTDHMALGLEATYAFYKKATINDVNDRDQPRPSRTKNTTKFASQATDVFARVSYKW